jgi:hypothetical protein
MANEPKTQEHFDWLICYAYVTLTSNVIPSYVQPLSQRSAFHIFNIKAKHTLRAN